MVCNTRVDSMLAAPNKDHLEMALKEINETEDRMRHNEKLILEWIKYQKHLPSNIDRMLIRGFLRGCKHNIEKTKRKLEMNLSARLLYPQLFSNRSPFGKEIQKAMDNVSICFLPQSNSRGERMAIFRMEGPASEFDMIAACKLFYMTYDLFLTNPHPCAGEVAIFDASGCTGGHLAKFTSALRMLVTTLREAYAIRLKRMHVVNVLPAVEKLVGVLKPLLHKNVRNNFVIHYKSNELSEHIGKDAIPSDYGGNLCSVRELALSSYEVIKQNADWFEKCEDMKLKGAIPKKYLPSFDCEHINGIEGSFRKLDID